MIEIIQLNKSFKGFRAVSDLSLQIGKGEYLALLGPNGAGKTTLVEMIEGLQEPDSGEIRIKGLNWKHHALQLRRLMGLSLQETKFVDRLTVRETFDLFGSFYHLPKKRSLELLDLVNLEAKADTYSKNLSGGQRQRMALGIAVMHQPEVLLLDEPTTGLDPNARHELWDILLRLRQEKGTTMILTTHYMEEAEQLCDRIVILDKGRILADGTLASLLASHSQGEIISYELDRQPDAAFFQKIGGMRQHTPLEAGKGVLLVDELTQALPQFLDLVKAQGFELREIGSRKKTLDDLFMAMTGRRLDE